MGNYIRGVSAAAYQIKFTDEEKDAVKKGVPTVAFGDHIKLNDGVFSVAIHLGPDMKIASEGDWVVKEEDGKMLIATDDAFEEVYTELADEDEEEEDAPPPAEEHQAEIPPIEDEETAVD